MTFRSPRSWALLIIAAMALSCRSEGGATAEPPPPANGTKKVKVTFDNQGNPVAGEGSAMRPMGNMPGNMPPNMPGNVPGNMPPNGGVAPPDTKGSLSCDSPPDWKKTQPNSAMRMAQWSVPRAQGDSEDGELALFYFGPNGAGGVDETFKRWMAAFDADAIAKAKRSERKSGTQSVTQIEVAGNFDAGKTMTSGPGADGGARKESALLGAILQTSDGPYYFKLTGPIKTVTGARKGFDSLLDGCKVQPPSAPF